MEGVIFRPLRFVELSQLKFGGFEYVHNSTPRDDYDDHQNVLYSLFTFIS